MISARFDLPPGGEDLASAFACARQIVRRSHDPAGAGVPEVRLTIHAPEEVPTSVFERASEILETPVVPIPCSNGLFWSNRVAPEGREIAFFLGGTWLFAPRDDPPARQGMEFEECVGKWLAGAGPENAGCRVAIAWEGIAWKGGGEGLLPGAPVPETPLRAQTGWTGAGAYPASALVLSNRGGLAGEKAEIALAAWCLLGGEPFGREDPRPVLEGIRAACGFPAKAVLGLPSLEASPEEIGWARGLHESAGRAASRVVDSRLREEALARIQERIEAVREKSPDPSRRRPSLRSAARRGLRRGFRDIVELPPTAPEGIWVFGTAGEIGSRILLRVGTSLIGDRIEVALGLAGFPERSWLPPCFLPAEDVLGPLPHCPLDPVQALAWFEGFGRAVALVRLRFREVIGQALAGAC